MNEEFELPTGSLLLGKSHFDLETGKKSFKHYVPLVQKLLPIAVENFTDKIIELGKWHNEEIKTKRIETEKSITKYYYIEK